MVVDIPDVVTYTNFGDHRLRGFWVAGGQISPSPIDFHRRPSNTLALPCERVMRWSVAQTAQLTHSPTADTPHRRANGGYVKRGINVGTSATVDTHKLYHYTKLRNVTKPSDFMVL